MQKIQKEFKRIRGIEDKLYEGIKYRQQQHNRDLDEIEKKRYCEVKRKVQITDKNMKQQVMHPYNDGAWVYLAHCLDEQKTTDLDGILQRQKRRQEIRNQIQNQKNRNNDQIQEVEEKEKNRDKAKNKNKKEGKEQVPWKLMRRLREQDVAQNKKRIEKVRNYQQQYTKHYHK